MVVEEYTSNPVVGNTNTTIYNFLKNLYNNPPDGIKPTYLLIVGDDSYIPSFNTGSHVWICITVNLTEMVIFFQRCTLEDFHKFSIRC